MSLKYILLNFTFIFFLNLAYSQPVRQFKVQEVVQLFAKSQLQVINFLSQNLYESKGNDAGFEIFQKSTSLGNIRVLVAFKNKRLSAISTMESIIKANEINLDFNANGFKVNKLLNIKTGKEVQHDGNLRTFVGCMYQLQNEKLSWLKVAYIISPSNPNIITINYGATFSQHEIKEIKEQEDLQTQNLINEDRKHEQKFEKVKENEIKRKIDSGMAFDEFEFASISRSQTPSLYCEDTIGLKSFILNCLFKDRKTGTYNIVYDTLLNPVRVTRTIYKFDNYGGVTNETQVINDSICSRKEILENTKKYFKLNTSAIINIDKKNYSVPIIKYISIEPHSTLFLTKQKVKIKKGKGDLNIEMTDYSTTNDYAIMRNPFVDNSYIDKIREYIQNNPPSIKGEYFGIYNVRRTDYVVKVVYNDVHNTKHSFANTIWEISGQYKRK